MNYNNFLQESYKEELFEGAMDPSKFHVSLIGPDKAQLMMAMKKAVKELRAKYSAGPEINMALASHPNKKPGIRASVAGLGGNRDPLPDTLVKDIAAAKALISKTMDAENAKLRNKGKKKESVELDEEKGDPAKDLEMEIKKALGGKLQGLKVKYSKAKGKIHVALHDMTHDGDDRIVMKFTPVEDFFAAQKLLIQKAKAYWKAPAKKKAPGKKESVELDEATVDKSTVVSAAKHLKMAMKDLNQVARKAPEFSKIHSTLRTVYDDLLKASRKYESTDLDEAALVEFSKQDQAFGAKVVKELEKMGLPKKAASKVASGDIQFIATQGKREGMQPNLVARGVLDRFWAKV